MKRMCYLSVVTLCLLNSIPTSNTEVSIKKSECEYTETTIEVYADRRDEIRVESEEEIGIRGSMSGMRPTEYDVKLTFNNGTHYNGKLGMWAKVVAKNTKYIMVNVKPYSPSLNYKVITVGYVTTDGILVDMCIRRFIHIMDIETLVIELAYELRRDTNCLVTFDYFTSFAFDKRTQTGAEGLLRSAKDSHSILHCLFKERLARSVFPCMDHPALKAKFHLTIDYPPGYMVASNTQPIGQPYTPDGTILRRQVFKQTHDISTYVFAFAVMENYLELGSSKYATVGLWAPPNGASKFLWILEKAQEALDRLQLIFQFQLPLDKLDFLIVDDYTLTGIENFGLVSLKRQRMESSTTMACGVLFHEIVHQWIGNVVTIREWSDLSLQESLTGYLTLLLLERFFGVSISEQIGQSQRHLVNTNYDCMVGRCLLSAQDVNDNYYSRGPIVFNMIAQKYGGSSIESFASELVNAYAFKNATLDKWDSVLNSSLSDPSFQGGYLRRWFAEPGPATLHIRLDEYSTVIISQDLADETYRAKEIFLKLYISNFAKPIDATINEDSFVTVLHGSSWLIVDPDSQTLTRKLYTSKLYLQFFNKNKESDTYNHLTENRVKAAAEEFCRRVYDDLLPLPDDNNVDDWKSILRMVLEISGLSSNCVCCITSPTLRPEICLMVPYKCDRSKLIQMVGYN